MQATAEHTSTQHRPFIQSGYLGDAFRPERLRRIISSVVEALRPHRHEFDSIAFRGLSGALVAPAVAARLGKFLLCVRKADNRHSSFSVEGNIATERYCIVDDFVNTGRTIENIIDAITAARSTYRCRPTEPATCWGIALWKEYAWSEAPGEGVPFENTTEGRLVRQFGGKVKHAVLARRIREQHGIHEF